MCCVERGIMLNHGGDCHGQAKQRAMQDANDTRQRAESEEVAGCHNNDGQNSHEGADTDPRGQ